MKAFLSSAISVLLSGFVGIVSVGAHADSQPDPFEGFWYVSVEIKGASAREIYEGYRQELTKGTPGYFEPGLPACSPSVRAVIAGPNWECRVIKKNPWGPVLIEEYECTALVSSAGQEPSSTVCPAPGAGVSN